MVEKQKSGDRSQKTVKAAQYGNCELKKSEFGEVNLPLHGYEKPLRSLKAVKQTDRLF
jgi:hypothetical protein